jgi:hypothetical protein
MAWNSPLCTKLNSLHGWSHPIKLTLVSLHETHLMAWLVLLHETCLYVWNLTHHMKLPSVWSHETCLGLFAWNLTHCMDNLVRWNLLLHMKLAPSHGCSCRMKVALVSLHETWLVAWIILLHKTTSTRETQFIAWMILLYKTYLYAWKSTQHMDDFATRNLPLCLKLDS